VSIKYGFKGPNFCVVSACASASHSLGEAFLGIKAGMMDVAIAGGSESGITPLSFAGFCSMKALSSRNDVPEKASSPFDKKRDGFVMGEGSGLVLLESLDHALARKARIYAEFLGYGATGDAFIFPPGHRKVKARNGQWSWPLASAALKRLILTISMLTVHPRTLTISWKPLQSIRLSESMLRSSISVPQNQ